MKIMLSGVTKLPSSIFAQSFVSASILRKYQDIGYFLLIHQIFSCMNFMKSWQYVFEVEIVVVWTQAFTDSSTKNSFVLYYSFLLLKNRRPEATENSYNRALLQLSRIAIQMTQKKLEPRPGLFQIWHWPRKKGLFCGSLQCYMRRPSVSFCQCGA